MKKTILTSFLLAAGMALAQTSGTSNPQTSPQTPSTSSTQTGTSSTDTSSNPSSNNNSVQGCLSGSGDNFSISDQSGKSWTLSGNTQELKPHVGHMVQITGTA